MEREPDHAVVDELDRLPAGRLCKLDLRIPCPDRGNVPSDRGISGALRFENRTNRPLDVSKKIIVEDFRESYFPFIGAKIKEYFEKLKNEFFPDLVFTHYSKDAHQDHRLISNLTYNTFRDHLIFEYEIPKYDGDLGNPNLFVGLSTSEVAQKIENLCGIFKSQKEKKWFDQETFKAILRLRGVECNSSSKFAEGFYCTKIVT